MSDEKTLDRTAEEAESASGAIARASSDVICETSGRLSEPAPENASQASAASATGANAAIKAGSSLAEGMQDIINAWSRFAEEVMRQTSEASRALIGCRSLTEMFEIQSRLLRGSLQAFFDQSSKIAEITGRMATRPFEAMQRASDARRDR